jgi:hypothetical protein
MFTKFGRRWRKLTGLVLAVAFAFGAHAAPSHAAVTSHDSLSAGQWSQVHGIVEFRSSWS